MPLEQHQHTVRARVAVDDMAFSGGSGRAGDVSVTELCGKVNIYSAIIAWIVKYVIA